MLFFSVACNLLTLHAIIGWKQLNGSCFIFSQYDVISPIGSKNLFPLYSLHIFLSSQIVAKKLQSKTSPQVSSSSWEAIRQPTIFLLWGPNQMRRLHHYKGEWLSKSVSMILNFSPLQTALDKWLIELSIWKNFVHCGTHYSTKKKVSGPFILFFIFFKFCVFLHLNIFLAAADHWGLKTAAQRNIFAKQSGKKVATSCVLQ